ncbi:hypothetical protein EPUS_02085 [Endocarpon pusillum Z07020]|uniref:PAC domain-containing protein n=1 Tax=Endocarpon pusillum (strain Z07020 / HMAS-L-300199) TaxID=1263415 RepID=U1GJ83_ENDPU|nr:uncharacterized protein EPUS_02085 [Endocarpon pusillum Z07020]ERF72198.1 hypothetical protein EPUS_02085 [Endocarpon pusillum Z07020]
MPSVNGALNTPAPPWWTSMSSQPPSRKHNGSDVQSQIPEHIEDKPARNLPQQSHSTAHDSMTRSRSDNSQSGMNGTVRELAPLQDQDGVGGAGYDPVSEDNPASYDLLAPTEEEQKKEYSLEKRSQLLFSREHLQVIFNDPSLLFKFTAFLTSQRPQSLPLLVYYLDTLKAIRAIHYANAILEGLDSVKGHDFTCQPVEKTTNPLLEQRANEAFDVLAREDLPAYITSLYISVVTLSITKRVTGSLPPHLREASEGLAEVFCLTDPSRPDNPIVFASEEFNRTTQYGMTYALGRNCRFLQGPGTSPDSTRRIRDSVKEGRHHQEVFLNYRRDGSPFMNLLMTAPLCDSRGKIRYFIGAQVDVSGLVKECAELESLQRLLELREKGNTAPNVHRPSPEKRDEFQELCEMLNMSELSTVRKHGGKMHSDSQDDSDTQSIHSQQPRLLLKDPYDNVNSVAARVSGKLGGIYQNYLLVRPHPSLRILFASPSQRVPGILQSPFLDRIGGSPRVREELTAAFADGRGVTAKVRWLSRSQEEGRSRWIHCTPLVGINGQIGVWMVVIVDDERAVVTRNWKPAPPVPSSITRSTRSRSVSGRGQQSFDTSMRNGSLRSESPNSLLIG